MAYFLPSYFQKRLLRYALSRLDFIDTDALDLENLGLTFGQRSVIEIKNVGLKVQKVLDTLQIPSNITLHKASVGLLRLTVPADLHASGIEVEVDGVEIALRFSREKVGKDHQTSDKKSSSTQNRTDSANRSRISSPPVHDPGGDDTDEDDEELYDVKHVIPTSQDLATSFLESEPAREREELQAALQSQSLHMQESTMSASESGETGLGMPGGFSLPTFVANFFKGVADRLSVKILNVAINIEIESPGLTGDNFEVVKFALKLGEMKLDGLTSNIGIEGASDLKRTIFFRDLDFGFLSEQDSLSQASGTSSPKFTRLRSKTSPEESDESLSQSPNNLDNLSQSLYVAPEHRESSTSSESQGSSQNEPNLAKSSILFPDTHLGTQSSDRQERSSQYLFNSRSTEIGAVGLFNQGFNDESSAIVDNMEHAEQTQTKVDLIHSEHRWEPSEPGEDLTESKLFSHDDAESMYMSAISHAMDKSNVGDNETTETKSHDGMSNQSHRVLAGSDGDESTSAFLEANVQPNFTPYDENAMNTWAKQQIPDQLNETKAFNDRYNPILRFSPILRVDSVTIGLPQNEDNGGSTFHIPEQPQYHTGLNSASRDPTFMTRSARPNSQSISQSRFGMTSNVTDSTTTPNGTFTCDIGMLVLDFDLITAKLLSKVSQSLLGTVLGPQKSKQEMPSKTQPTAIDLSIDQFQINLWDSVAKISTRKDRLDTDFESEEQPLLQLRLSTIKYWSFSGPVPRQKFTITKIDLKHCATEVLSFVDSVNVRDSIATSSMLRPHDLVVSVSRGRFEVQVKPVHVILNLSLLDEVLSRSGGISSLLDLGNSMVSTDTITGAHLSASPKLPQRTVRFDAPRRPMHAESEVTQSGNKIDVRISGTVIDLVGSQASIQLKSSAIKVVYRQDNIRIAIDGAAAEGPLVRGAKAPADVFAKLKNIQIHYSTTPQEDDLDRLLSLITPSNNKYDNDDDIMVDTLLRQRRKGGVLRLTINEIQAGAKGFKWQTQFERLADELSKLSGVTKYLPEDDRPGILTFVLINKIQFSFQIDERFGSVKLQADLLEAAQISVPSLAAAQISSFHLSRNEADILIGEVIAQSHAVMGPPMLMCRFIADEMEPTIRMKLSNVCLEYKVKTFVAITNLMDELKDTHPSTKAPSLSQKSSPESSSSDSGNLARRIRISVAFHDSAIALYPERHPAKGLFLLSDAVVGHETQRRSATASLDLRKASLLVINDAAEIGHELENADHKLYFDQNSQIQQLTQAGFVPLGSISSASATIKMLNQDETGGQQLDIEFRNNLMFLETCADSTQTLIQILSNLAPPAPPSKIAKYRTEVVPLQDMLASFTGNAFVSEPGPELGLQSSQVTSATTDVEDNGYDGDYLDEGYYNEDADADDELTASYVETELSQSRMSPSIHVAPVEVIVSDESEMNSSIMAHSMLDFRTDHFVSQSSVGGTAHRWDSARNTYDLGTDSIFKNSPLKVRIRDIHVIWNLFDGYDWQSTRDTISDAVKEIEIKALARKPRSNSRLSSGGEDDESVIGDFLFNSIYIGISANQDPRDLTSAINHNIDDLVSETGSYATRTTATVSPSRHQSAPRMKPKKLKLNRSKHHKMAFELEGVSADIVAFPPNSGEVESSIDIRIRKLEIFDHIPTSTWKKFATYMRDAGEREVDTNMVHIEMLNVKPIAELAASEIVLKLTVLPLRLHVDQDALDFLSRFFEFKDDKAPPSSAPSNPPFLQRAEVNPIKVKLDFKPKRVDYNGLRSGRTTEFMNFFILDRADMELRRVILYGVSGFDRLGLMLNSIWMPDVRKNQLPGVLAGLAPIRPLVDVGTGVMDLVTVPIREYRKDGRIVRSIQKGAVAFAKTTATELVNLGAKLAIGTQQVLQNAEGMLVQNPSEVIDPDDESKNMISPYADQPLGIVQGLRGGYASLERDLLLARDAIVAVPGEIIASGTAAGAAKAVLKQGPTIILRPAIGATKAVGQTLLGAGNALDKTNLRRVEEVSVMSSISLHANLCSRNINDTNDAHVHVCFSELDFILPLAYSNLRRKVTLICFVICIG